MRKCGVCTPFQKIVLQYSVPEFWCPDVAGLRQIIRDYSCNGIYLDEIAYDRVTMLRARKVLGNEGSE